MLLLRVLSILGSLVIFGVIIDFIRRGVLKEKYSVLWIASACVLIVMSLWKQLLDKTAGLLGITYPPSLLFLVAFIFVLLIMLHFSVVISIFHERNKVLSQELTLLKNELKEFKEDRLAKEKVFSGQAHD